MGKQNYLKRVHFEVYMKGEQSTKSMSKGKLQEKEPGEIGENITTQGVPYDFFEIGGRYRVGDVEIEITEPCKPCSNLRLMPYVGDEKITEFMKTMLRRRGWYAKVITEGKVTQGDSIERLVE